MKLKELSLPSVFLFLLCYSPAAMACCGHCHGGHHTKTSHSVTAHDSIAIQKFSEKNEDLLEKIEIKNKLIAEEYRKESPDFDRIATLKKEVIDYHTKLDKKAAKKKITRHHQYWCPMHK